MDTTDPALWLTVTVTEDGTVAVTDVIEGTAPDPFPTVMGEDGEQLGRLILALGQVESAYSGIEPLAHVQNGVQWLTRHGYLSHP